MSSGWRQMLGVTVGAWLAAAGCTSNSTCGEGSCPRATFAVHALGDSTVTWAFAQSPEQTSTGFVTGEPAAGQCRFDYEGVLYPSGTEIASPGLRALACSGENGLLFNFLGLDLGDPRTWTVGTYTLQNQACAIECASCGPAAGTTGAPCSYGVLDTVDVTVVVEDAVGTAAPMPKLVTDDFVRTFRVELDTSAATARSSTGGVCDYPVTENVSLHLTQAATDYVYDANAPCPC
jgi:hypothetical protein